MKHAIILMILLATLLLISILRPSRDFDVVAINSSESSLGSVKVSFKGFAFSFGSLSAKTGNSTYGGWSGTWPNEIAIEWEGMDDRGAQEARLKLSDALAAKSDERLELVVEFAVDGLRAYPRVRESLTKGLKYRYR